MKISPISSAFTAASSVDSKPRTLEETSYVKNLDTGFDTVSFEGKGLQRAKAGAAAVLVATTMAASSPPPAKADATPPATAAGEVVPGEGERTKILPDAADEDFNISALDVDQLFTQNGRVYVITEKDADGISCTPAPDHMITPEILASLPPATPGHVQGDPSLDPELLDAVEAFNNPSFGESDKEIRAHYDKTAASFGESFKIDVDQAVEKAYEKYDGYLNENMPPEVVKLAIASAGMSPYHDTKTNLMGISPEAVSEVNNFLRSQGKEPLDPKDPSQNIEAFLLAVSLNYDQSVKNPELPHLDIAKAVSSARSDSSTPPEVASSMTTYFWNDMALYFGFDYDKREANLNNLIETYGAADLVKGGVDINLLLVYSGYDVGMLAKKLGGNQSLITKYGLNPSWLSEQR